MNASHDATINDNRSPSHPGPLLDSDWGRPSHHRTHNLLLLPSWDLPVLRDRSDFAGKILGGWTATVVYSARSGTPVDTRAINNSFTATLLAGAACYLAALFLAPSTAAPGREVPGAEGF